MPSFTIENPAVQQKGLIVVARIGVTEALEDVLVKSGQAIPAAVEVEVKIDTGADRSVISEEVVEKLGLKPVGAVQITTATTANAFCCEYAIRILFPNKVTWQGAVICVPNGNGAHCLIGRDILAHSVLVYIGYSNVFSLSF